MVLFKYTHTHTVKTDWPKKAIHRQDRTMHCNVGLSNSKPSWDFEWVVRGVRKRRGEIVALIFGHISRPSFVSMCVHLCMYVCVDLSFRLFLNIFRVYVWLLNRTICYTFLSFILCAFSFTVWFCPDFVQCFFSLCCFLCCQSLVKKINTKKNQVHACIKVEKNCIKYFVDFATRMKLTTTTQFRTRYYVEYVCVCR